MCVLRRKEIGSEAINLVEASPTQGGEQQRHPTYHRAGLPAPPRWPPTGLCGQLGEAGSSWAEIKENNRVVKKKNRKA